MGWVAESAGKAGMAPAAARAPARLRVAVPQPPARLCTALLQVVFVTIIVGFFYVNK